MQLTAGTGALLSQHGQLVKCGDSIGSGCVTVHGLQREQALSHVQCSALGLEMALRETQSLLPYSGGESSSLWMLYCDDDDGSG